MKQRGNDVYVDIEPSITDSLESVSGSQPGRLDKDSNQVATTKENRKWPHLDAILHPVREGRLKLVPKRKILRSRNLEKQQKPDTPTPMVEMAEINRKLRDIKLILLSFLAVGLLFGMMRFEPAPWISIKSTSPLIVCKSPLITTTTPTSWVSLGQMEGLINDDTKETESISPRVQVDQLISVQEDVDKKLQIMQEILINKLQGVQEIMNNINKK